MTLVLIGPPEGDTGPPEGDTGPPEGDTGPPEGDTGPLAYLQLHTDIRQHFQSGTDTFIDKTLHGALKTAEECITKAVTISDDFHSDSTGVSCLCNFLSKCPCTI